MPRPPREGVPSKPRLAPEAARRRSQRVFTAWASGKSYEEAGQLGGGGQVITKHLTVDEVRRIIRHHVRALWIADAQWKKAEARCRALAMELNLLRIGKEAPPDKPIESLAPPECWRKAWLRAGIETVNQLRSIDPVTLLAQWRFPRGALDWAVMKLDREGLSHRLIRAKRTHMPPSVSRRIER